LIDFVHVCFVVVIKVSSFLSLRPLPFTALLYRCLSVFWTAHDCQLRCLSDGTSQTATMGQSNTESHQQRDRMGSTSLAYVKNASVDIVTMHRSHPCSFSHLSR